MEILYTILAVIVVLLSVAFKHVRKQRRSSNQRKSTPSYPPSPYQSLPRQSTRRAESQSSPSQGGTAHWYAYGQRVVVKNYDIPGGLLYVGTYLPDAENRGNEASLINPNLDVSVGEPWLNGDAVGYSPKYESLLPMCRGGYLKWLATGRAIPQTCIGYVLLFFFGLERRFFYDSKTIAIVKEERDAIIYEVQRLLSIYQEDNTFKHYANKFLLFANIINQNQLYLPENIESLKSSDSVVVELALSSIMARKQPLSAHLALLWLSVHPDYSVKTPARRAPKEFQELFKIRYQEKFQDGLFISPINATINLQYKYASPSLDGSYNYKRPDLTNPFNSKRTLNKINAVAEECASELDAYSRSLGRKSVTSGSFASWSQLPTELILTFPKVKEIKAYLENKCQKALELTTFKELQNVLGMEWQPQCTKKDAEIVAEFMERLGYGLMPDVRYYGQKPDPNGSVVIFPQGHGPKFIPSQTFLVASVFIKLGSIIAQSDGKVSKDEEVLLEDFIDKTQLLTPTEKNSLSAYLFWNLNTPQSPSGLKQKLPLLDQGARESLTRIMLSIAQADGKVDIKETRELEKIYALLGFDKGKVKSDLATYFASLKSQAAPDTPVKALEGEATVAPLSPSPVVLNDELLRISEHETREVQKVLGTIFSDPEEDAPTPKDAAPASKDGGLTGLDDPHKNLVLKLKSKSHWERDELKAFCEKEHLMLDGAMEVINEWSFQKASAPLIEDGDPIFFDIDLFKEIENGNDA